MTPSGRNDCKVWRRCVLPTHVAGQPHSARIRRSRTTTQVGVSHDILSVLVTHRARDPPFWTSWWAIKMVAHGARERMFCHVVPIRMPCTRSLACCLFDLICRIEDVAQYRRRGGMILAGGRGYADPDIYEWARF